MAPCVQHGPHRHQPRCPFGSISFIGVRLGGQTHKDPGGTEQWRYSAKVFKYPRYNETTKDGDLMLIKFLLPVHVNKQVKPLPLASRCPVPGETCQISGWGSTTSPEGTKPLIWGPRHPTPGSRVAGLSPKVIPSSPVGPTLTLGQPQPLREPRLGDLLRKPWSSRSVPTSKIGEMSSRAKKTRLSKLGRLLRPLPR